MKVKTWFKKIVFFFFFAWIKRFTVNKHRSAVSEGVYKAPHKKGKHTKQTV